MQSDGSIPHHVHQSLNLVFLRCVLSQGDSRRTPRKSSDLVFSARCMAHFSTGYGKSCCGKSVEDCLCITHVVSDLFFQLCFSLRRVNSLACSLHDIRSTIELGSVTSCPEAVNLYAVTYQSFGTTVKPRRTPVKPAFLEKLRSSIAQVLAPSHS